ncbi:hypothetical protein QKW60_08840 [Defluviimonas aestuarii]|uniref:hypothetical protein n=1 Tax=Albidovulum aestuarii TaxID=1130726 RepID=UPI00249C404F|nr:hypothetical protein [Defluviimonas aestuarii]MDI3336510.1 hypothetical protein [Defluviimonas aestuarii]
MTSDEIAALFTRSSGDYVFARWSRPIVPVVFGTDDATLATVKGAVEAVVTLAGHKMAETDPEQGANLMIFFFREWRELLDVPDLDRLVEGLEGRVARLEAEGANQYRHFRFEETGAIRACIAFIRMDDSLQEMPAETIALSLAAQVVLLWSDTAFREQSPLALVRETVVFRPDIGGLIRAAYDPVMPDAAQDPSHAMRLAARMA